jgi:translocation and assembly module TamA
MASLRHWVAAAAVAGFVAAGVRAGHAAGGMAYRIAISGGNDALNAQLKAVSRLVGAEDKPPPGLAGLDQRAQTDRQAFQTVLRSEGYYDGSVEIALDDSKTPVSVAVTISQGPRYRLGACSIVYSAPPPAKAPKDCKDIGLKPAMAARSAPIIAATEKLLRKLQQEGRPVPKLTRREAIVDHAAHRMQLTFHVDPGRQARFGQVVVKDAEHANHGFLARLVPWKPKAVYDVRKLDKYRRRLANLNLFDRLTVKPDAAHLDETDVAPIMVDAHERPSHSIGGGASYATDTGPGLKAFWEDRNLWGRAERLRFDLQLATIAQSLEGSLTLPHEPNTRQSIGFDAKAERDVTDAYDKRGVTVLGQLTTPLGGHWTAKGGLSLEAADIQQAGASDFSILGSVPLSVSYDSTKALLNPRTGERLTLQMQPVGGTSGGARAFLILQTAASAYRPLDDKKRIIAAARLRLGSILFSSEGGVPADLRFYSGGGGSVRGFAYQHVGPRDAANNPIGGRAVAEASLELRYRAWKDIGIVAFADAGMVSTSPYFANAGAPRLGAGLGLRYYTSFGPLRLDVAAPLNPIHGDAPVQVYISLGQAF